MSKLYARVFAKILESSIADDWQVRMVFQDFLLLAEDGTVDMTRQAIARRTNVPLEIVERAITVLEEPDPRSRDRDNDGRRIVRLDPHRDWGWQITNWEKYESIRCKTEAQEIRAARMRHYRQKKAAAHPNPPPAPPPKDEDIEVDVDIGGSPTKGTRSTTRSTTTDTHTDLPPGFPQDEKQAADHAGFIGCPPEFAVETWNLAAGRGGRDAKGVPIRSWRHHLAASWKFHQNRTAEGVATAKRANGSHPGGKAESTWELKTKLDLIEKEMQECRNRGMRSEPHGDVWDDSVLREKHKTLRQKRDDLKARITA